MQEETDLSEVIMQRVRIILSDGQPRTDRELAQLLAQSGLVVHKSLVNQVLMDKGKPTILCDRTTYHYYLAEFAQNDELPISTSLEERTSDTHPSNVKGNETNISHPTVQRSFPSRHSQIQKRRAPSDLMVGMIVRAPIDTALYHSDFRDFRIGHITEIDWDTEEAEVSFRDIEPDQTTHQTTAKYSLNLVSRCLIIPNSEFVHRATGDGGLVLIADDDQFKPGYHANYHVILNGSIQKLPESEILILSHRQDPNPLQQLQAYEFHSPIWKSTRDIFVEAYRALKTATFGVEDLVSSRILLMAHQAEAVTRVLADDRCRYILADEVGLGKTIEACVILKGLRKRYGDFKTLLIAPAALVRQWYNELDTKFWLRFTTYSALTSTVGAQFSQPGLLVTTEELQVNERLWQYLQLQRWGLLIVDEAHHIRKLPDMYDRLVGLSANVDRTLILSATPIQRRGDELFDLLRLMDPERYGAIPRENFQNILDNQRRIRETVIYNIDVLTPELFENEDFSRSLQQLLAQLVHDKNLAEYLDKIKVAAGAPDQGLQIARQALTYLSENYRIESRMIRNRRANLEEDLLPEREVDTSYTYSPLSAEQRLLEELHIYLLQLVESASTPLDAELCRVLLHSAASSPDALLTILQLRKKGLASHKTHTDPYSLLRPASPRKEISRIEEICRHIPAKSGEHHVLDTIISLAEHWAIETRRNLEHCILQKSDPNAHHRLRLVLRAIDDVLKRYPAGKIVVFSSWCETLEILQKTLTTIYSARSVAEFHSRVSQDDLDLNADRFQADETCHLILCDELGGEGRNFQFADAIVHVDLPWTPAQIEQRIGRVDRLGRSKTVRSIVVYARGEVEEDLYRLWQNGLELFSRSMSGLEIAVEDMLDSMLDGLQLNPREAIARLLPQIKEEIVQLREEVEQERLFEFMAVNTQRAQEFEQISQQFQDGEALRTAVLNWANLAGLENSYEPEKHIVSFFPKRFNMQSIRNAKFFRLPNMNEALLRSRNSRTLEIKGTFDRSVGVQREELIFFAPGEPWTDSITANALEADRGRCAAIYCETESLEREWHGFEFIFGIEVNPRPLFDAGFMPVHLYHAQGYLMVPMYRVIVNFDGEVLSIGHPVYKLITKLAPNLNKRQHMGRRGDGRAAAFRDRFPPDLWEHAVASAFQLASEFMHEEFSFMEEEAQLAEEVFEQKAMGLRAHLDWLNRFGIFARDQSFIVDNYRDMSKALVVGIRHPLFKLESAAYWMIEPQEV